ncbi:MULTISPECIES: oxygenase MpaB family protein [unclassified Mycobacterium]|uniref:oxygenase MpaB family protein n=1 Tax=unclassified Mycobacterium TaxID=2642494 RepID=UPI001E55B9C1|nr:MULTISPECIES: oxygenase MpaB family protein [unclassified Mycobacterium]
MPVNACAPGRRVRRNVQYADGLVGSALLAGPANVIMQLARPGVGYGVVESRVESGRTDLHPIKRARTTFTYLAVAILGSDDQKAAYRSAVNTAHRQVYSTRDSPVKYSAMDKNLQLWVAACLFKGALDVYRLVVGELDDETAEEFYRQGMTMGTTLQVTPEMWPADRAAFDKYWQESLDQVHIDDTVREYLYPIAAVRMKGLQLPGPLQRWFESFSLLLTTGFLPQRFRDEMRLPWDAKRQKRFNSVMKLVKAVNRVLPGPLRRFPFNWMLRDLDWRIRTGRPLV